MKIQQATPGRGMWFAYLEVYKTFGSSGGRLWTPYVHPPAARFFAVGKSRPGFCRLGRVAAACCGRPESKFFFLRLRLRGFERPLVFIRCFEGVFMSVPLGNHELVIQRSVHEKHVGERPANKLTSSLTNISGSRSKMLRWLSSRKRGVKCIASTRACAMR